MSMDQTMELVERNIEQARNFVANLLGDFRQTPFAIRFWDGSLWSPMEEEPKFILALQHPGALRRMFLPPTELKLGEAYIFDDFDVEGNIEAAFTLADYICDLKPRWWEKARYAAYLLSLSGKERPGSLREAARLKGEAHSKERDSLAVTYHYNVSNDFYRLWLDQNMVYSCAYFTSPSQPLDEAQEQKLDYICRKLRLRPGDRLLDIGCGWGGLIRHAAEHFGVEALGITLSEPQAELANERIAEAGLADRCRAMISDYRDLDETEEFDKLVSVGMFEHVGESRLDDYFQKAWRLLKPGGVFLNHGISQSALRPPDEDSSFIDRYVFPDGEVLPIAVTLREAESCGFETRDVESLREHYAMTLRHWVKRLEARHTEACREADEVTYRVWRIYMAGSAYGFGTGKLNLYQTLLVKPVDGDCRLPLTRQDWYH